MSASLQFKEQIRSKKYDWQEMVEKANECIFENNSFRENQLEIINASMDKRDVLALIPTGGGKSLTF